VIAEAAGFALLASISPTALVVMAVFLGSESPRRIATTFAAGAIVMTVAAAVASLFILRAVGLNLSVNHDLRYGRRCRNRTSRAASSAGSSPRPHRAPPLLS